jgi:hypothetical protein
MLLCKSLICKRVVPSYQEWETNDRTNLEKSIRPIQTLSSAVTAKKRHAFTEDIHLIPFASAPCAHVLIVLIGAAMSSVLYQAGAKRAGLADFRGRSHVAPSATPSCCTSLCFRLR